MIAVSVIMPVYNTNHKLLHRAIKSILSQTLKNIELILIDDGSTNGSEKICDEYAALDKRVQVIHKENCGICAARNNAIKIAKGEYIGFCDHDDEYGENQLLDNYNYAKKYSAEVVKFGYEYICLDNGPKYPFQEFQSGLAVISGSDLIDYYVKFKNSGILCFVWDALFSAKWLADSHISFDERFMIGQEDINFCNELYPYLSILVYNPQKYYRHYRYKCSTSRKMDMKKTIHLLSDEIYVFENEMKICRDFFEDLSAIRNDIIKRNMLVFVALAMRKDADITWKQRINILSIARKVNYFDNTDIRSINGISSKACFVLFYYKCYNILMMLGKLYIKIKRL